jgi:hypothetical protein
VTSIQQQKRRSSGPKGRRLHEFECVPVYSSRLSESLADSSLVGGKNLAVIQSANIRFHRLKIEAKR